MTMKENRDSAFYEAPKMDGLMVKHSKNFCDFLSKMLIWDFKDRWSAKQLMEHSFLRLKDKIKPKAFSKSAKKENDLSFMVDALIEYYSNKHWMDKSKNPQHKIEYSDKQIIGNLCKHSGCTEQEVTTMIKYAVGSAKQKINTKPIRLAVPNNM